jgi:hypothetical protein
MSSLIRHWMQYIVAKVRPKCNPSALQEISGRSSSVHPRKGSLPPFTPPPSIAPGCIGKCCSLGTSTHIPLKDWQVLSYHRANAGIICLAGPLPFHQLHSQSTVLCIHSAIPTRGHSRIIAGLMCKFLLECHYQLNVLR